MSDDWAAGVPSAGGVRPAAPVASSSTPSIATTARAKRPPVGPDVLAVVAVVGSGVLALAHAAGGDPVAAVAFVPDSLADAATARPGVTALFGYLLTPFGVVGALGWARATGLRLLDDPWFDTVRWRAQLRRLQAASALAFGLAVPHVLVLARLIQAAVADR